MVSVPENLEKILQARYGEEVRGAIHDSIESIYNYTDDDHVENSVMSTLAATFNGTMNFSPTATAILDYPASGQSSSIVSNKFINNNGVIIDHQGSVVQDVISIPYPIELGTDDDVVYKIVSASKAFDTRCVGVYDAEDHALGVYDSSDEYLKNPNGDNEKAYMLENYTVSVASIFSKWPNAKSIRFCSYTNNAGATPLRLIVSRTSSKSDLSHMIRTLLPMSLSFLNDRYVEGDLLFDTSKFKNSGYTSYRGKYIEDANAAYTDYISIFDLPETIHVHIGSGYETRAITVYDYHANYLGSVDSYNDHGTSGSLNVIDGVITRDLILSLYADAQFVRFCSYFPAVPLASIRISRCVDKPKNSNGNVLYGKKYVVCGDSFSAELDTNGGRPYGKVIAERNNMSYVNLAIAGTTMSTDVDHDSFATTQYKKVPADADYITLCYGLNEESAIPDHIGEKSSTDISTIWGAWNFSLKYLITNMPFAKIGIIIADAWTSQQMHDLLVEIAEYWGIPYLDLKESTSVPMGLNGRLPSDSVNSEAVTLRTNAFRVSASDGHPNEKAHAYRSTYIENFLRSL